MIAALIAVLWMPLESRLAWMDYGPSVTLSPMLSSVVYGDDAFSRWIALDELEVALDFPDDAAFTAARVAIVWGE